ncbi:class I adenylate-forming enzyme family protein [Pseudomonas sp. Teo4]|uniref:class I adenylate-forming enzyme family protein n=1 Tax=Pseudomonas sp. Teo4 TaxID=3064528 RepID=UPI002AB806D1|nr:AMP-binding protein [Pseudomonas sp. Teo4]MDZ3992570.1 Long-chain-fatty-acid--CoA ligase [Pseudomonas sp. Teo4]
MNFKVNPADGIPAEGAFNNSPREEKTKKPLGEHRDGRWVTPSHLNSTYVSPVHPFRAYRERPENYDAFIRRSAALYPNREAVVCGERRVTWAEFDLLIERTACGYTQAGLTPQDRVAVMLDNRLEYLVAMMAAIRAGAIAIPLGTRLGAMDVDHILKDAQPKIAVTAVEWLEKFKTASCPDHLYIVGEATPGQLSFENLQKSTSQSLPKLNVSDIAMIVYTSGTTGKPKGACLTHLNFIHTCLHYLYALGIDQPLKSLLVVPGTHIAGFGPLVSVTMASGGTVVLSKEFKPTETLDLIVKENVNYAVLVPAMYQLLAMKAPVEDYDLSSWVYGVYGGAIMPPATIERFSQVAPGLRMINAYGATETCAVCTIMPPELTRLYPASVGLSLECDDIEIMDENGVPVAPGVSGELWIRGPNVSPGYWNNTQATEREFQNGYWKSGDVGHRDENGLIYVSDRLKDMINRGGFKVFSAEVENSLMSHEDIDDCAVIGVPDSVLGEKTYAKISTRNDSLRGEALKAYLLARIADYKVPDFWSISSDPIPRNQNGKVQKAIIREIANMALQK